MNIDKFISQSEFEKIGNRLKNIQEEIQLNSYNIFTISSYNSYLENFHSDIIAILLNPEERHREKNKFLNLFLDFLVSQGVILNKEDYRLCKVTREVGQIDIWIKDTISKKSIIIENKINNARDREKQLADYFNYARNEGFEVDSVVYLTLNGFRSAPHSDINELNEIIINISAFTNSKNDLSNGWLQKCYENSQDDDNRSFIFQYLKLIRHLSQVGLDRKIKEDFYSVINKEDGFEKTKAIAELVAKLEEYRADLFATRIEDNFLPFRKRYRWKPNHWLFENYNDNGIVFKIDVIFHSDGSADIHFWNPAQPEEMQKINSSTKLNSIGLLEQFEYGGFGGGMVKRFSLGKYGNIQNVDNEIYSFTEELFKRLRQ